MELKLLYSAEGKVLRLANKERQIFKLDDQYVDLYGNPVTVEDDFKPQWVEDDEDEFEDETEERWHSYWIKDEGLDEPLISESTIELEWEIDDAFGNFGFKNRAGDFVIEPQFAYAHEFTCGLAAVNLNRTWYKTEEGRIYYENHFGYINHRGETIIPFSFDEAYPFNKYGVAIVEYKDGQGRLIDTKGNFIPGTEELNLEHYYDYDTRFLEFTYVKDEEAYEYGDDIPVGVYDTKERKIILEPSIDSIIEWDEDHILVYLRDGDMGVSDFHQYYMNSKGEPIFTWLMGKGFAKVERPNKSNISIVAVSKYRELEGNPSSFFEINGKKYERDFIHGLYTADEEFLLPMEYDDIHEIEENVFVCKKDGVLSIYTVEE